MKDEFKSSMRECFGLQPVTLEQAQHINRVWCLGYICALQHHVPESCRLLQGDLNNACIVKIGVPIVDETWFWWVE